MNQEHGQSRQVLDWELLPDRNLFGSTCPVCQQMSVRDAEMSISMELNEASNGYLFAYTSHLLTFYPRSSF